MLVSALGAHGDEEKQFILYLELEALKAGIVEYLGITHLGVENDRCRVTSIEHTEDYIELALVILPPKELPKIISCGSAERTKSTLSP